MKKSTKLRRDKEKGKLKGKSWNRCCRSEAQEVMMWKGTREKLDLNQLWPSTAAHRGLKPSSEKRTRESIQKRQGCLTWLGQAFECAAVKCCQPVIIANESMCLSVLSSETVVWIFFSFSLWSHTYACPHTCPFWTKKKYEQCHPSSVPFKKF